MADPDEAEAAEPIATDGNGNGNGHASDEAEDNDDNWKPGSTIAKAKHYLREV